MSKSNSKFKILRTNTSMQGVTYRAKAQCMGATKLGVVK